MGIVAWLEELRERLVKASNIRIIKSTIEISPTLYPVYGKYLLTDDLSL
jgi:hypothetical protein